MWLPAFDIACWIMWWNSVPWLAKMLWMLQAPLALLPLSNHQFHAVIVDHFCVQRWCFRKKSHGFKSGDERSFDCHTVGPVCVFICLAAIVLTPLDLFVLSCVWLPLYWHHWTCLCYNVSGCHYTDATGPVCVIMYLAAIVLTPPDLFVLSCVWLPLYWHHFHFMCTKSESSFSPFYKA